MQVLGPWSESHELARYGGGKSRGLGVLHAHGLRVPPWAVLGADIFDRFLIENGLSTLAQEFAAASDESDAQAVAGVLRDAIATAVRQAGCGAPPPPWLGQRPLADWAGLWDTLGRMAEETELLNLDRKQAVLVGLGALGLQLLERLGQGLRTPGQGVEHLEVEMLVGGTESSEHDPQSRHVRPSLRRRRTRRATPRANVCTMGAS